MSPHDQASFATTIVSGVLAGKAIPVKGGSVPIRSTAPGADLAASGVAAEEVVAQAIGVARNTGPGRIPVPGSGLAESAYPT